MFLFDVQKVAKLDLKSKIPRPHMLHVFHRAEWIAQPIRFIGTHFFDPEVNSSDNELAQ